MKTRISGSVGAGKTQFTGWDKRKPEPTGWKTARRILPQDS
jgi:hypothetical protein